MNWRATPVRLAARVRFQFVGLAVIVECSRPRLERNGGQRGGRIVDPDSLGVHTPIFAGHFAAKEDFTVGSMGCRQRGRGQRPFLLPPPLPLGAPPGGSLIACWARVASVSTKASAMAAVIATIVLRIG